MAEKRKQHRKSSGRRKRPKALIRRRRLEIALLASILLLLLIFGSAFGRIGIVSGDGHAYVNSSVRAYEDLVREYAAEHGIPEYVDVLLAMMQQESSGRGTDVMQCSECLYNTKYSNEPGSIDDPEYSIDVGTQYFATCVEMAGCKGPGDTKRLKLALQGYNYGYHYITWALERDRGYSPDNAMHFSEMLAEQYGWSGYGDPYYVEHVLRYFQQ